MKGWVGLVGWPVADGLPTLVVIHQLQVERRTGKVRRPETDVLPLCHATNRGGGRWDRQNSKNPSTDRQNICRVLLCRRPLRLCHIWYNVTLLLNCVEQTNTNLSELELNDSETPVSRTVYLICVAYSQSRCTFNYIFMFYCLICICILL